MRDMRDMGADRSRRASVREERLRATAGLREKGYQVISPRDAEAWSGIVSFVSPTHDHKTIWRDLRMTHNTELALREGRLRISAHLYNTEEQIDHLIAHLPGH